jgi:drug/metabolite transporter (DMT)-like permease
MSDFIFYTLNLLSDVAIAIACISLKEGIQQGCGVLRSLFIANLIYGIAYIPFLFFTETHCLLCTYLWKPILAGFMIFLGQMLVFLAMRFGDITVQTPLMGLKLIFIAFFTYFVGFQELNEFTWIAVILSVIGISVLGINEINNPKRILTTIALTAGACASLAIADLMIQTWAPDYGHYHFTVYMSLSLPLCSLLLIPFIKREPSNMTTKAKNWTYFGSGMLALGSILFVMPIAFRGQATIVNILSNTRGLWAVFFVWIAGSWLSISDNQLPRKVLIQRFIGALLLLASVSLVI